MKYTSPITAKSAKNVKKGTTHTPTVASWASPVCTRSKTRSTIKWKIIYSHPSKHLRTKTATFKVRTHVLCKTKHKTYIKCRVNACPLAYITFHTVKDLNIHHRIYDSNITYKCTKCKTVVVTPSSWKYHRYGQKPKLIACDICDRKFTYNSQMQQHRRSHVIQRHYKCFYGRYRKTYKHPQDLNRHVTTHLSDKYDCEMCDKSFHQKRLLKRHEPVHSNIL